MLYDLIIIGGGPAGVGAGIYAARKRLRALFITFDWGGQSIVSSDIQNWIGTVSITGEALGENLKQHLLAYQNDVVDIKERQKAATVETGADKFIVTTDEGEKFETKTVFVATGAHRRRLTVPGAAEFEQKGLTYCASCDGPLFADKDVAVIGGGNAGFETAAQLLAYCRSVTLLNRSPEFKADPVTVEKVLKHPKMKAILNSELLEIKGDKFVTGLVYRDSQSGGKRELAVTGIFAEIGLVPTTDLVKGLVNLNKFNQIVTDPKNQRTSVEGIWAAGDCTDGLYHQNNIAAGDAVKAVEDIYLYLMTK